jgi:GNAT superfamily N-acetyltransferase
VASRPVSETRTDASAPAAPGAATVQGATTGQGATTVRALEPDAYRSAISELADLILDAVAGGAGVNFLTGVSHEDAAAWWRGRAGAIADGSTTLFVAVDAAGRIIGSTLLIRSTNQNSPHRAEIGKVIVRRDARRQGLGRQLMDAAEARARTEGRWLLILDTATGSDAESMYRALGWQELGVMPNHALSVDGVPTPTTYFWKDLR